MGRGLGQFIDRWHLRKVQARWMDAANSALDVEPQGLRALRSEARGMRRQIDRVILAAEHRLGQPALDSALPRLPMATDWRWRADLWRGPISRPGSITRAARSEVSDDVALYHDCPLGEAMFRQTRNTAEADRAPFGLVLEVFCFRGSFLSLAVQLPGAAVDGLKARHIVRLDMILSADRPLNGFVRLNVKHGANVAQLVGGLPSENEEKLAEFDLAYAGIDEARIESAWVDVIFKDVAMTRVELRDMVVSRRPRAEV